MRAERVPVVGNWEKYNFLGAAIAMRHNRNFFAIDTGYNMIKGHTGVERPFVTREYAWRKDTMREIIRYLISFLLGTEEEKVLRRVSYGESIDASVVILPSGFFDRGTYLSMDSFPHLPLQELDGTPVLFGDAKVERTPEGRILLRADLVASAFFLLSRYEECVRRDLRDVFGRFLGEYSLAAEAGFLKRPIVDEYGVLLRRYLRETGVEIEDPPAGIARIYLTHDVDNLWTWDNYYRAARSTLKRLLTQKKDPFLPLRAVYNFRKNDPVYTFPWMLEIDANFLKTTGGCADDAIYFLMGCTDSEEVQDKNYLRRQDDTAELIKLLSEYGVGIGYHLSCAASKDPGKVASEIAALEALASRPIQANRNHYLNSREPEDYRVLLHNGILEDFTMGYADTLGFRLGTCRPVRWIDPVKMELTALLLHPLSVMEVTLGTPAYMRLREEEAFSVTAELLEQIRKYHGEVVLLWHNTSFAEGSGDYYKDLYLRILERLKTMREQGEKT